MIDLVLAYRPNGLLVGALTLFDFVNSIPKETAGDLDDLRAAASFGHLAAPQQGQVNIRPVILAHAYGVPDDLANDVLELVNNVGGRESGLRASEFIKPYSDFTPDREPMKVKVEERREFPPDQWVIVDGRRLCTVCGEENCGWMARSLEGAK